MCKIINSDKSTLDRNKGSTELMGAIFMNFIENISIMQLKYYYNKLQKLATRNGITSKNCFDICFWKR